MMQNIKPVVLTFTLGPVAIGCADEDDGVVCDNPEEPCPGVDSNDEVGDGDGDGDEGDDPEPVYCVTEVGHGTRTVYQCNGHLTASISFRANGSDCPGLLGETGCTQSWEFGADASDPYDMPAVMACCDAEGTPESKLLIYCAADLISQVCASVPAHIDAEIEAGFPKVEPLFRPIVKAQAKALSKYLKTAEAQQDCWDTLHRPGDDGIITSQSWLVNGGKNGKWSGLEDFTVTIDKGVVMSASLPENLDDALACEDNDWNDGEVFEEPGPLPAPLPGGASYRPVGTASVPIVGPFSTELGRVVATGEASFGSCEGHRCSVLEFGDGDDGPVIVDLDIYADGPAVLWVGDESLMIEGLALRLYGVTEARTIHGNDGDVLSVSTGSAQFRVTGSVAGTMGTRWAVNSSPIVLRSVDAGWYVEHFTVQHTDVLGSVWQATVPGMTWQ